MTEENQDVSQDELLDDFEETEQDQDDGQEIVDDSGGVVDDSNIDQEKIDRIVQQRLAREKEKQRKWEEEKAALQKERDELKNRYEPPDELLEVPELPDVLDNDYDQKIKERDQIILKKAIAQARKEERQAVQAKLEAHEQQRAMSAARETYLSNAKTCGIKEDDAIGYAAKAGQFFQDIDNNELAEIIINEKRGILAAEYLCNNPEAMQKFKGLPKYKQTGELLKLTEKLKPGKQTTPKNEIREPSENAGGSGKDWVSDFTSGATFD